MLAAWIGGVRADTNSCRHAFGENDGTIRVELKRRRSRAESRAADHGGAGDGLKITRQLAAALEVKLTSPLAKTGP